MNETLHSLVKLIDGSFMQEGSLFLLRNVPGFPPVIQTIHILGISIVMGTIVMICLRVLGLALPNQCIEELTTRLMPWFWIALIVNAISGSLFIFALPGRYFNNPVFIWKFAFLIPAIILAGIFHAMSKTQEKFWSSSTPRTFAAKTIALISLCLWIMVPLAGRWIAYAEYLYYPA